MALSMEEQRILAEIELLEGAPGPALISSSPG